MKQHTLIISLLAFVLLIGGSIYVLERDTPNAQVPENEIAMPEPVIPEPQTQETSATTTPLYLGISSEKNYSLLELHTGETSEFIPPGYNIADAREYPLFPEFLILQKENLLYSYLVADASIKNIFSSYEALKKNEAARVYPSITEKDKFIIRIDTFDLSQVSEFDGSSPMLGSRTYSFDASTHTLVRISNPTFNACAQYDSQNKRFFTWPCGEGVGSATPLSTADVKGKVQKEILSAQEFGLPKDNWAEVRYQNGIFVGFHKDPELNIVTIDPTLVNPVKKFFTANAEITSKLDDVYPYSLAVDEKNKTLIIGGSNSIVLLRFDDEYRITQSTSLPDPEIYANFIFVHEGTLYYRSHETIRVVDLRTWQVEKSIPTPGSFGEITLFAF